MNEILMKIDTEIFEISENDYYTKEAKENVIKGLVKAKEIIQAEWKATPTIIINLPSLSDQDIEDYKDKLKEIFDEKEKYEQKDLMTDYHQAREIIKQYCQNEDCNEDCKECTYPLSVIRCGEEWDYKGKQIEPCYSQNECKYKENDLCNIRKEYGYRELKLPCPKLQKPLTKGDVIREISNNAELAKEIFRFCNELSCNYDFSMAGLLAHLNQLVESEE